MRFYQVLSAGCLVAIAAIFCSERLEFGKRSRETPSTPTNAAADITPTAGQDNGGALTSPALVGSLDSQWDDFVSQISDDSFAPFRDVVDTDFALPVSDQQRPTSPTVESSKPVPADTPIIRAVHSAKQPENVETSELQTVPQTEPSLETAAAMPVAKTKRGPTRLTPEDIFERACAAVVRVNIRNAQNKIIGHGSGFFVGDNSTVVTNFHVIDGAKSAEVVLHDNATLPVLGVQGFDATSDVAILKVADGTARAATHLLLQLKAPPVGRTIYIIGAPQGLDFTLSDGLYLTRP